jgi:hypothetical protein
MDLNPQSQEAGGPETRLENPSTGIGFQQFLIGVDIIL